MERKSCLNIVDQIYNLLKTENVLVVNDGPVLNFKHPKDLMKELDLCLTNPITNSDEFLAMAKKIINYSVKTSHPNFYNQLYGGVDIFGFCGALLSEALNTNQHTYEVSPVFTLVEQEVIKHFMIRVGFNEGDGIFCPGGSIANMYGLALARYSLFPESKEKGMWGLPKLVVFTSEDGHYSIMKAANWMGLGSENVIKIKTLPNGKMCIIDLQAKILEYENREEMAFFVNATAGTTVLGAVDPISEIADICRKYKLWLHIDASFGGTLLLSNKHKTRLEGIDMANSLSWNPHKMLGAPLQCSVFLTKHPNLLLNCNSASANYLFQPDKIYDVSYDTGDKSIQCGRKVDAFKLWAMWKIRGDMGLERLINNAVDCALYFKNQLVHREGFRLISDVIDTTSVCFFFIPPSLRNKPEDESWFKQLNSVAPTLKNVLLVSGDIMICYTPLPSKGLCNFFRLSVTCHPLRAYKDMDHIIKQIENYGKNM